MYIPQQGQALLTVFFHVSFFIVEGLLIEFSSLLRFRRLTELKNRMRLLAGKFCRFILTSRLVLW